MPAGARFCPDCGQDLRLRGDERRVVTVMFADLVGYTALSELRDPEQVKNLVDGCFERLVADIDAFGGRVDKIVGDAIVALFGAPTAHEDDAERAVRAALRMQETLAASSEQLGVDIRMRVGVNTGEVLVGALRAGGDYTAMGDVVNTANRLQTAARPGEVLVGSATYAATRRTVRYEVLEPIDAKGREELVPAWRAESALAPPGYRPERNRAPLLGRHAELGLLCHSVENAIRNSRGALLLLLGEAGVGKSRLAEELATHVAEEHDALILEGRCVPYGEANVWWPVADALRHGAGIRSSDPADVAIDLARSSVATALGEGASEAEIERVHQGLLFLMGYESELRGIDPARAREEATEAVITYADRFSQHRPVVVVLSDLHWADDLVLELVDTLLDRLSSRRFVVLATARQPMDERWHPPHGRHNLVVLTVDSLTTDSAAELLAVLAGEDLGDELARALLDRSGGNPFFMEELVTLLAEAGMVGGEGAVVPLHGRVELPDTLRGLVAARLDGLTDDERRVLEGCAVLGRRGPLMAIVVMASKRLGVEDVRPILEALQEKDLLVLSGAGEAEKWTFRSDLVREVAYGTLTKSDRARSHAGIAAWMEEHEDLDRDHVTDRITYHYVRAAELLRELGAVEGLPPDLDERALHWLERAAARANQAEIPMVAEQLYSEGLALIGEDRGPLRRAFLAGRARALAGLRDLKAARVDAEAAVAASRAAGGEGQADLARALLVLAEIEQKESAWPASEAVLAEAADVLDSLHDPSGAAEVLRLRGFGALLRHEYDVATELLEEARARFEAARRSAGRGVGPPEPGLVRLLLRAGRRGRGVAASGRRHLRGARRPRRPALGARPPGLDPVPAGPRRGGRGDGRGRPRRRAPGRRPVGARDDVRPGRLRPAVDRAHPQRHRAAPGGPSSSSSRSTTTSDGPRAPRSWAAPSSWRATSTRAWRRWPASAATPTVPLSDREYLVSVMGGLGATVQVGDVERSERLLAAGPRPEAVTADDLTVGDTERVTGLGLHRLQIGDVAGAVEVLAALDSRHAPIDPNLHSALALAHAAAGEVDDRASRGRRGRCLRAGHLPRQDHGRDRPRAGPGAGRRRGRGACRPRPGDGSRRRHRGPGVPGPGPVGRCHGGSRSREVPTPRPATPRPRPGWRSSASAVPDGGRRTPWPWASPREGSQGQVGCLTTRR